MKIKDLIKLLKDEDQERIVVMSSDSEGNSYSPLSSISTGSYVADTAWSGEVGLEQADLTDYMRSKGYSEEDVRDGNPCLILHPVN